MATAKAMQVLVCLCLVVAVAQCQTLSSCENSRITVNSVELDSPVQQLVFATVNKQEVYALTHGGHLWFSYNGGSTWEDKTSELEGWDDESLSYDGRSHGVSHIIASSGADHLVYFRGHGYVFWVTRDGEDYKQYTTGDYEVKGDVIVSLLPNPFDPNYIIRGVRDSSCDLEGDTCFYRYDVSAQQGAEGSWVTKDTYIGVFSYGGFLVPDLAWGGYEDQILYTTVDESLKEGDQFENHHVSDYSLVVAADFGSDTSNDAGADYCTFLFVDPVIYVGKYDAEDNRMDSYLSADYGESFVEMVFRNSEGEHIDGYYFFIMPATDQDVSFINIQSTTAHPYGDLYEASTVTADYYRTLPNNRIQGHGPDFFVMPTLDGIFAANSYNVSAFEENGSTELESYVKSTFTYNKGGVWHGVMPPDELYCSNSDPFCTLNLYMLADQATITPMLADKNAVGLILAQGNEGYYRQDADEALFLYLSRNGGVTWDRLMEGSFQFTMASHGSLFLAAENDRANNTLFYSWNQGAAFDGCIFAEENVFIESIVYPEPSPTTLDFLLLGADEGREAGYIFYVDFTDNAPAPCVESQLEQFSPSIGSGCLLGARTEFTRRQREEECWNNVPQEREVVTDICLCFRNDYVCDGDCFEEEHFGHATVCTNICVGTPEDPQVEPEDCEGEWLRTQGYRKVEGDICAGGMDLDPVWVPCSDSPSTPTATPSPSPASGPVDTASPSPTPAPVVDGSALPSPSPSPVSGDGDPDDGGAWVAIVAGVILCLLIVVVAILIVLICLYKTSPKMRALMAKVLPARLTGGSEEDEMYQVMGKGGESLLDDDFYNEPDANVMQPMTPVQGGSDFSALPVIDEADSLDF